MLALNLNLNELSAAIGVSKNDFARVVVAEGIPAAAAYRYIPAECSWYRNHAKASAPWLYAGKLNDWPRILNVQETVEIHFNLQIHEGFDDQTMADTVEALAKAETAFCR